MCIDGKRFPRDFHEGHIFRGKRRKGIFWLSQPRLGSSTYIVLMGTVSRWQIIILGRVGILREGSGCYAKDLGRLKIVFPLLLTHWNDARVWKLPFLKWDFSWNGRKMSLTESPLGHLLQEEGGKKGATWIFSFWIFCCSGIYRVFFSPILALFLLHSHFPNALL